MLAKNPKEVFVLMLSDARRSAERSADFYEQASEAAEDPEIKQALESRSFVSEQVLAKLDRCFKLIGEQPAKLSGRLEEVLLEDFRKELGEIQSPVARRLFVLARLHRHTQFRVGEYMALTAMADLAGHHGVGVLLESCLGDKLAFVERNRRLLRKAAEEKIAARAAST